MLLGRRALSCALVAGLVVPGVLVASPARADALVNGIVVDTGYSDGLLLGAPTSYVSPTYDVAASSTGATTLFRSRSVSTGSFVTAPTVAVTPPTTAYELAVGDYTTAATATDALAGLQVTNPGAAACSSAEGTLKVLEVTYTSGALSQLAATWSYRCTGATEWAFGELRYQSTFGIVSGTDIRYLQLGSSPVGVTSAAKTMYLRNSGTLPLTFGTAHFTGTDPADFVLTSDTCSGATLAVGTTCSVAAALDATAGGYREALLEIPDGTARGFRHTTVSGTGQTAPAAPTALATTTATDGVALSWKAPTDTGSSTITSFDVFRGTDPSNLALLGSTSSYTYGDTVSDTTATGTSYLYAVRAVNAIGAGPLSDQVTGTTPSSVRVPTATRVIGVDTGPGSAAPNLTRTVVADGTAIVNASTYQNGLLVSGLSGVTGDSPLVLQLNAPTGVALQPGSFPLARTADATHGTASVTGLNAFACYAGSGTADLTDLARNAAGDLQVVQLDIALSCGSATSVDHVVVRIGTDAPYTAVTVPAVDAGPVVLNVPTAATSTYTNNGTQDVTVTDVAVTAPDGSSAVDWALAGGATCAGATLAPGQSCQTALTVTPSALAARPALVVYTDSTPAGTHVRSLTASGTDLPLAVTSLSASRSGGKVTVHWNDYAPTGQRASSWTVLRGPDAAHLTVLGTATSWELTDPDTADGVRVYEVRGVNVAGTGPAQDLTVDASLTPPAVAASSTVTTTELRMTPSGTLSSDPVTGYRVYRGTTSTSLAQVADITGLSWTTTAPAAGLHAYFAVAPLVGTTVGPRSATVDVLGTSTQLVTASIVGQQTSPIRIRSTQGGAVSSLADPVSYYPPLRLEVAVSPRGNQVAYVEATPSGTSVAYAVWLRNLDGSGTPLRLTPTSAPGPKAGLAWSPDSKRVAYTELDFQTFNSSLWVVGTTGSLPVGVPNSSLLSNPSWLDSTTLVAEDDSSDLAPIVKLGVSTGTRTAIAGTGRGYNPSVRPTGGEIAFLVPNAQNDGDSIRVVTLSTGAVRSLSTPAATYLSTPSWTRDGSRMYLAGGGTIVSVASSGTGTYAVTPVDAGEDVASVSVSTPDTVAPTSVKLAGVPATTLGTSVTPTFSATDALNGVASYTVLYRKAPYSGGFGTLAALVTTAPRAFAVAKGYEYCFSVKATDRVGNTSAATPEQCTVVPLDDRSLARSSGFSAVTSSAYYAGTAYRATVRGQTLTRTGVSGARQLLVVATSCATCGTVDVLIGGVRVGGLNLASATTVNRRVFTLGFTAARTGTVVLKVTSSGKPVVLDGLGVRR